MALRVKESVDRPVTRASRQIIVPILIVTRANVEAFTKRINELRGRPE
jgi:hypothetical protein